MNNNQYAIIIRHPNRNQSFFIVNKSIRRRQGRFREERSEGLERSVRRAAGESDQRKRQPRVHPVVIDAQHHFPKKRFDHQFRWKPTPEIEMAILKSIFKTKP